MDKSLKNYKEFERKKDSDLMKILKDYVAFQTKNAQKVCIKLILLLNDLIGCKQLFFDTILVFRINFNHNMSHNTFFFYGF